MGERSTWRELECVRRVLKTFKNVTENKQIRINSDNKNVEHILKVGLRHNVGAAVEANKVSKDHILYDLTGKISSFLLDSRSNNTIKTYFSSFNRWSTFIKEHGFNNLPAAPIHVALYITNLIDKNCSPNVINSAIYSLKWVHELNGFAEPTDNSFVKSLQESAKRHKSISKLIYKNKKISYTAAGENILKILKLIAPTLNLGLHSLRVGGATAAASSEVNERCIKRHGRWKSDSRKDGYIADTLE
ncbi:Hypothetical predicted protein [Mytilus galloprovincialis]|uniref:Core-binding (CB) domain-containing protein n=1 Tax=Mytilus galloprovincialis TaxID=29158 RepID=A0A8B6GTD4_MYTGA|nr:Hypothetical predicted protein [Mytilus galloprovincialis]